VIGAGAAGLSAAIWARRTRPELSVAALDGARRLGAKILVAGGGRCNVTHDEVDAGAFAGSSRNAIRRVLLRFDVAQTIAFFREIGVELKREETGKLFPVTDSARTVLDALLAEAARRGVELAHPRRVETVRRDGDRFRVEGEWGVMRARRVVLATGGRSLPKSGSDGHGYAIARSLGHTITPRVTPALVPLVLDAASFVRALSGVACDVTLVVESGTGKRLAAFTGAMLCTHTGISGPCALDVSRYYIAAKAADAGARLVANWLPGESRASVDRALLALGASSPGRWLASRVPERLARALCREAGVDPAAPAHRLDRAGRRALAAALTEMALPVTGDRGYTVAEATAGGVPLEELRLDTLESRVCPGLHICGEVCDVDGRIGGYNFQWAWSSGYVAGVGAGGRLVAAG
jgi:predicted Rossmann fold flavoprotein